MVVWPKGTLHGQWRKENGRRSKRETALLDDGSKVTHLHGQEPEWDVTSSSSLRGSSLVKL
jgi:hypothetical protein